MTTPSNQEVTPAILTDEDLLDETQRIRLRIAREMTAGDIIPTDKGEKIVLLQTLSDIDKQALAKKKIGSAEKQGAADRAAALMIASLSNRFGSTSPFEVAPGAPGGQLPTADLSELEPLKTVPGETSQGIASENCESFMQRMEQGGTVVLPGGNTPSEE